MKRIHAPLVVAFMKHEQTIRDFSVMDFIRKAMSLVETLAAPSFLENSISSCRDGTIPKPA